jgi:Cd(II)/Pb(II)-responsive transcriptional regulator
MKIGELARKAQCAVETIRYYEKAGLLPSAPRTSANYRSYAASHVERLRFIRNCRALDMTHEEIRTLLHLMEQPASDCDGANQTLEEHIAHVDTRIAELSELKSRLGELRLLCQSIQRVDNCGILQGLGAMEAGSLSERHTHLG